MTKRDRLQLVNLNIYGLCCRPTKQVYIGVTVNKLRTIFSANRAQAASTIRRGGRPNKLQTALDFHPKSAFFMKALLQPEDEQQADLWRDQLSVMWNTIGEGGLNSKLVFYQDVEQARRAICDEVRALSLEDFLAEAARTDVWHG